MTPSLDAAWRCYAESCIPLDATDAERIALRRAFHTGAVEAVAALLRPQGRAGRRAAFVAVTAELTRFMDDAAAGLA